MGGFLIPSRYTMRGLLLADVMLKEFQSGPPALDPDREPGVRTLANYISSDTHSVAAQLLQILRRKPAQTGNITGWRLWFDLAEQPRSVPSSQPPVSRPAVAAAKNGIDREIADRIEEDLRRQHLIVSPVALAESKLPEIRESQQIMDLSQVLPKMFVRRHEMGEDRPGSDPYLDQLTADVNGRLMSYASQYRELEDLIQVFRAYVAARKIMGQYPAGCCALHKLPLLPSERVQNALPYLHPTPLIAVHVASIALKDSRVLRVASGSVASLSGGIGMNYRLLKSPVEQPTVLIEQIQHTLAERQPSAIIWNAKDGGSGQTDRRFIALKFDLDNQLKPVTMASLLPELDEQLDRVLKKLDLLQTQQANENLSKTNQRLRRYIAILLSILVIMVFANGYLLLSIVREPVSFHLSRGQLIWLLKTGPHRIIHSPPLCALTTY